MTGLRKRDRDRHLPARLGDGELVAPADQEVLRLVQELLLDADAPPPTQIEQVHARWKLGVACAATYSLRWSDGVERWVTWKKHLSGKARRHEASLATRPWRVETEERLRPAVLLPDGSQLVSFPRDRVLRGLERALDDKRTIRWIKSLELFLPEDVRRRRSHFEPLRYKPERRAVLRAHLSLKGPSGERRNTSLGVRVHEPEEAQRIQEVRAGLTDLTTLRTPRLMAVDEDAGILLEEWVEGAPCAGGPLELAEQVGAALAALHALPAPAGRPVEAGIDLALLDRLDPDLCAEAQRLLESVPPFEASCLIHGDMHQGQWLETPSGELVLLDLDALRAGEPEEDLAAWLMDVELEGGPTSRVRDHLLQAYRAAGGAPLSSRRLDQLLLRACIANAVNTLRRLEANAEQRARLLLETARRLESRSRLTPTDTLTLPTPEGVDREAVVRAEARKDGHLVIEIEADHGPRFYGRPLDGEWTALELSEEKTLKGLVSLGASELLAWRPGRRAALRSEDARTVTKVVRPKRLKTLHDRFERSQILWEKSELLAPPPLQGQDPAAGLLHMEWCEGRPLALGEPQDWQQLGAGLRDFQVHLRHEDLPRHGPEEELEVIETLGMRQALAGLELPVGIETVHIDLTDQLPARGRWCAVHRDLHDGQLLRQPDGRLILLDLDLLSSGAPELDLANLGVHLVLRAWQGRGFVEEAWAAREALLEGYRERGGELDPLQLDFYERCTALRLVLVYRMRPRWISLVPALMDVARGGLTREVCLA